MRKRTLSGHSVEIFPVYILNMRLTLKAVNEALSELGESVHLVKGDGYFYFDSGEAANWIDKTVTAKSLSSLTLEQWIAEFKRLKKLNREILAGKGTARARQSHRHAKPKT